jgi:hypothetical protein
MVMRRFSTYQSVKRIGHGAWRNGFLKGEPLGFFAGQARRRSFQALRNSPVIFSELCRQEAATPVLEIIPFVQINRTRKIATRRWRAREDEMGDVVENLHFHFGGVLIEERHASPSQVRRSWSPASRVDSRNRRGIDFRL